jgi:hypothetical protein
MLKKKKKIARPKRPHKFVIPGKYLEKPPNFGVGMNNKRDKR